MTQKQPVQKPTSFLIRVWPNDGGWRVRVQHIGSGRERSFLSLEQALAWIASQAELEKPAGA